MKDTLAEILNVKPKEVHIITWVKGSIDLEVIIENFNRLNQKNISKDVKEDIEKYTGRKVDLEVLEPTYIISENDFDVRGDIDFF
jgi:hypothetical protein